VKDVQVNKSFKVMPNPTKSGFELVVNDERVVGGELRVTDMAGRQVFAGDWSLGQRILTSNWQVGHYLVLLHTAQGVYRSHLVVE
jgi:hypothetical protein